MIWSFILTMKSLLWGPIIKDAWCINGGYWYSSFSNYPVMLPFVNALCNTSIEEAQPDAFVDVPDFMYLENVYWFGHVLPTLSISLLDYFIFCSRYLYRISTTFYFAHTTYSTPRLLSISCPLRYRFRIIVWRIATRHDRCYGWLPAQRNDCIN